MPLDSPVSPGRRRLISLLGGAAGLLGLQALQVLRSHSHSTAAAQPAAGTAQRVSETEPLAQSLGYKEDASKVDKAKFPNFKPGQKCASCRFFQGAADKPSGPCQIFSGKLVNSNGWCSSYNAKT